MGCCAPAPKSIVIETVQESYTVEHIREASMMALGAVLSSRVCCG